MGSVPQRQYAEIISDLEAFDVYLTSLQLRHGPNRLRRLIANLREIDSARAQGTLASLHSRPDVIELVWSLVEGQEFADIFGTSDRDKAKVYRWISEGRLTPAIYQAKQKTRDFGLEIERIS